MNFQAMVLIAVILAAVVAFAILPGVAGRYAKRSRRKAVAFEERHQAVNLFKDREEPSAEGSRPDDGA